MKWILCLIICLPISLKAFADVELPTPTHVDAKYKERGTPARCRQAWHKIRTIKFKPSKIDIDTLLPKAVDVSVPFLKRTLEIYLSNRGLIPNQRFVGVIDLDRPAAEKRFFVFDLHNGDTAAYFTAVGDGSDPHHTGVATLFSNAMDKGRSTHATSLGCYLAGGEYRGAHGRSLLLHGFEFTNDNACAREIVIHAAPYVINGGRSNGCFAVTPRDLKGVIDALGAGGLICAYRSGFIDEAPLQTEAERRRTRAQKPDKT